MISFIRFEVGVVIAGVCVASVAGCRPQPSTASRSAAAYDEALREGVPLAEGGGHDHAAPAPAAGGPGGVTHESAHAGQDGAMPSHAHHEAGDGAHGARPSGAMDHAAMGHGPAAARPDHGQHAGMDHGAHGAPAPKPDAPVDHAAMGHAAAPAPEPASATATPGQPAGTLDADALDWPAAISLREAARSRELAASGHTMTHGTYRQVDAGRPEVPATSPTGRQRRGSAPATDAGAASGHAGHGAPTPSPAPKENR